MTRCKVKDATGSGAANVEHRRWCPVCRQYQTHDKSKTPGPCSSRRDVIVVGLEVHVGDEVMAVCDNYTTRDKIAAMVRERV